MKLAARSGRYQIWPPDVTPRRSTDGTPPRRTGNPLPGPRRSCIRGIPTSSGGDPMTGEDVMVPNTETDQLRLQLLQAQRLSSVGALASSVAHEFNNILTTIINYAKLAVKAEGNDAARTQALEKILKGSQRAALIINSMLGFARNSAT